MGLLKSLFKAVGQKPEAPEKPTGTPLVLEGEEERTVYTYDPKPLKGLRKGSVFYADVVTSPVTLTSPTGGVWDTGEGGVALSYNGGVFGSTGTLDKTFHELADAGYSTKVKVKRLGMYDQYVPEVVMLIPDPNEVFLWRDACRGLGREIPFEARHDAANEKAAVLYSEHRKLERAAGMSLPMETDGLTLSDEGWLLPDRKPGKSPCTVTTSWLPVPQGSSAKPHISIALEGAPMRDISARSGLYQTLSSHVGEQPLVAVYENREDEDGRRWCRLAIVYRKEAPIE